RRRPAAGCRCPAGGAGPAGRRVCRGVRAGGVPRRRLPVLSRPVPATGARTSPRSAVVVTVAVRPGGLYTQDGEGGVEAHLHRRPVGLGDLYPVGGVALA